MGVRAIMDKHDLEYEDLDIINKPDIYAEMVEKSGQPLSPCVEIDGVMLADVSGDEGEREPPWDPSHQEDEPDGALCSETSSRR